MNDVTNTRLITNALPSRNVSSRVRSETGDRGFRQFKIPTTVAAQDLDPNDRSEFLTRARVALRKAGARFYDIDLVDQRATKSEPSKIAYVVSVRPILSLTR